VDSGRIIDQVGGRFDRLGASYDTELEALALVVFSLKRSCRGSSFAAKRPSKLGVNTASLQGAAMVSGSRVVVCSVNSGGMWS
jgi:hypothetical protein